MEKLASFKSHFLTIDETTLIEITELIDSSLHIKMSTLVQRNFVKDKRCPNINRLNRFPLKCVYHKLTLEFPVEQKLKLKWKCKLNDSKWQHLRVAIQKSKIVAMTQITTWKLLFHKFPISINI